MIGVGNLLEKHFEKIPDYPKSYFGLKISIICLIIGAGLWAISVWLLSVA